MIPRRELDMLRGEWSLELGVIEKDYVPGWVLAGIAQHPDLAATWIFKGGTCPRKCYYETFRFSEDLDFTVVDGVQFDLAADNHPIDQLPPQDDLLSGRPYLGVDHEKRSVFPRADPLWKLRKRRCPTEQPDRVANEIGQSDNDTVLVRLHLIELLSDGLLTHAEVFGGVGPCPAHHRSAPSQPWGGNQQAVASSTSVTPSD